MHQARVEPVPPYNGILVAVLAGVAIAVRVTILGPTAAPATRCRWRTVAGGIVVGGAPLVGAGR